MRELCIAGAASRGVAYLGAMECLRRQGLLCDLETILGVSAGGLVGALWFIGMSPNEAFGRVMGLDTKNLLDWVLGSESLLRGCEWRRWVFGLLGPYAEVPMGEFRDAYGDLRLLVACLEEGLVIVSGETMPDMPLGEALLATMALPFVFPPVRWGGRTYVDGGLLDNFPLGLLSEDAVGLVADGGRWPEGPLGLLGGLVWVVSEHMRRLRPEPKGRAIRIGVSDFGMVDFGLSLDDKVTLYMRGYEACVPYVDETIRKEVRKLLGEVLVDPLVDPQVSCD